ncbi:MAG TPA: GDSL-type esterase/lipase family protein [Nocardioidaceae bacterium]|nr:GDSL-type esterase/lipase family protein [Nocardioidaceae bacterium]
MRRQQLAAVISILLAAVLAVGSAGPAQAARKNPSANATTYPTSIASLGDSITRGFNANGWYSDWPARSWSTGTDTTVNSHYLRLRKYNSRITAYNDARTGAKMTALAGQASSAVSQKAQYVTILLGANDACTETEGQMTSVASFSAQFKAGMDTLAAQASPPKVLVASIPDIYRLYDVGRTSASARSAWSAYGICQSMLANPQSTDQADVDRRARVRQRVVDYNTQLANVCATYTFCKYDGGAVFGYPFTLSQLSQWDYFHPNSAGQTVLATQTWKAGFWPTS